MKDFVPSSPYFFRIVKLAMALLVGILLLLAMIIPAPLNEPGNITKTPNPAKAAWFFLWIQELVSYSKYLVYMIILVGFYFLFLPYLPGCSETREAKWLPEDQKWINIVAITTFLVVLGLTIIAMFFRGENWAFVSLF